MESTELFSHRHAPEVPASSTSHEPVLNPVFSDQPTKPSPVDPPLA